MSLVWISLAYFTQRNVNIIYMMKDFRTSVEWAASRDAISIVTYFN